MSKSRNIADLGSNDVLATTATGVDVTGTVSADGLTVDGDGTFGLGGTDAENTTLVINATGSTNYGGVIQGKKNGSNTYLTGDLSGMIGSGTGYATWVYGNNPFNVYTNSDKRLSIAGNGDIQFYEDTGTTPKLTWSSSEEQLQITSANTGAGGWTENVYLKAPQYPSLRFWETTGGKVASIGNNGDGSMVLSVNGTTGSVGTNAMLIDPSGNVGIGTSSPSAPLTVTGNTVIGSASNTSRGGGFTRSLFKMGTNQTYVDIQAEDTTKSAGVLFSDGSSGAYGSLMYDHSSDSMITYTNASERARIDSSGNLLVGTTSARGEGVVSKKGINYRSSNNSINGVQTYTRTYVSDQNNWRTILTRGTNTQGIAEVTVYTSYATPASIGSITRVLVLPNQTYTVISQEGSSTNGYSSMEFQWVGDDFQVRTVAQYLSYTCLVLLSDSGANLWPSQS
jgi:hypothetical protein